MRNVSLNIYWDIKPQHTTSSVPYDTTKEFENIIICSRGAVTIIPSIYM